MPADIPLGLISLLKTHQETKGYQGFNSGRPTIIRRTF